jgi:hypothetical protein
MASSFFPQPATNVAAAARSTVELGNLNNPVDLSVLLQSEIRALEPERMPAARHEVDVYRTPQGQLGASGGAGLR